MTQTYKFYELFVYGKDKEVYEISHSPVSSYIGKKVVLKQVTGGLVIKEEGSYYDNDSATLVVPYGSVTGATFKKVDRYEAITVADALEKLSDYSDVYIKAGSDYTKVGRYTDLVDLNVEDFDDLMYLNFYKKI